MSKLNCPKCGVHIDEHPASYCLNEWVWSVTGKPQGETMYGDLVPYVGDYSGSDVADASMLLEQMRQMKIDGTLDIPGTLTVLWRHYQRQEGTAFVVGLDDYESLFIDSYTGYADTYSLAVCRFVIKAMSNA